MQTHWHYGCFGLTAAVLLVVLTACLLMISAIRSQAVTPPAILIDAGPIWIGDVCRDMQRRQMPIACPPTYDVKLLVRGQRTYRLFRIPIDAPKMWRRRY